MENIISVLVHATRSLSECFRGVRHRFIAPKHTLADVSLEGIGIAPLKLYDYRFPRNTANICSE
jgi:hypothetical protein